MTNEMLVSLISAVAAILQVILVVASIFYLNRQFAIVRACTYIERFNTHENIRRRGTLDRWLKSSEDDQIRIRSFENDADLQADVLGFINLFQELGVAFLRHNVHEHTVRETFDFLVPHYWSHVQFLIRYLRSARKAPTMYRRFELLAKKLAIVGK